MDNLIKYNRIVLSFFFFIYIYIYINCVKFTSSIFFVIIEHQLACLVGWVGSSYISDCA